VFEFDQYKGLAQNQAEAILEFYQLPLDFAIPTQEINLLGDLIKEVSSFSFSDLM
jgi:hypothetical protein